MQSERKMIFNSQKDRENNLKTKARGRRERRKEVKILKYSREDEQASIEQKRKSQRRIIGQRKKD